MGKQRGRSSIRQPKVSLRVFVVAASIATVILICIILFRHNSSPATPRVTSSQKTPQYKTVVPNNTPIDKLGGWKRISPPGKDPVFAYTDHIDDVAITVSQQQLPKNMQQNSDEKTAIIAKKFNATTKVTAGTVTVYIGNSSKGPQSVIFTKGDTLVLIKSQKVVDTASWKQYIQSLN